MSEYDFVRYSHTAFSATGNSSNFSTKIDVTVKTICLTGNFDADSSRERIINRLVELGAIVKNGVIKSLDYLIVGNQGSADYKSGNKGGKIEKAEHYNENGADIQIVTESEFFAETEVLENV